MLAKQAALSTAATTVEELLAEKYIADENITVKDAINCINS